MMDCQECRRLWRDYSEAISNHFQLDRRLKQTGLTQGKGSQANLSSLIEAAAAGRMAKRDAIRRHMSAVHGVETAAAAGE